MLKQGQRVERGEKADREPVNKIYGKSYAGNMLDMPSNVNKGVSMIELFFEYRKVRLKTSILTMNTTGNDNGIIISKNFHWITKLLQRGSQIV